MAALAAALALAGIAAGCSGDDAPEGATKVAIALRDEGCTPARIEVPAGPVAFDVENEGAQEVTEFEILEGDHILGEVENIPDGLSRSFSLVLDEGTYTTYCPNADTERGELVVTPSAAGSGTGAGSGTSAADPAAGAR